MAARLDHWRSAIVFLNFGTMAAKAGSDHIPNTRSEAKHVYITPVSCEIRHRLLLWAIRRSLCLSQFVVDLATAYVGLGVKSIPAPGRPGIFGNFVPLNPKLNYPSNLI